MAVSAIANITLFPYGRESAPGEAVGLFEGHKTSTGAAGGGNHSITIQTRLSVAKNRLFLIRRISYQGPSGGSDLWSMNLGAHYWDSGSRAFRAGATVAGSQIVADTFVESILWKVQNNETVDPTTLVVITTPNVDAETWVLTIFGEYWEESRLIAQEISPKIRW